MTELGRWRPRADQLARVRYQALLDGPLDGDRSVVFVVADAVDAGSLLRGASDVLGLGLALAKRGLGVLVVTAAGLASVADADIVVTVDPRVDPSMMPPGACKVGWAVSDVGAWAAHAWVPGFDLVLAPSELARTHLLHRTPRVGLLRPAVDTDLFAPGEARPATEAAPMATSIVTVGAQRRSVHKIALRRPDLVTLFGPALRSAPAEIRELIHTKVNRFELPDLFRRSAVVVDDVTEDSRRFGLVSRSLLEAAACGAVPVTNGGIGVRELGFAGVPTFRTDRDLQELIERLLADTSELSRIGADLSTRVRREHSTEVRAGEFLELLEDRPWPAVPRHAIHMAPDYSRSNPYQTMLYADLGSADAYLVPMDDPTAQLRRLATSGRPGLFHLHWTSQIVQPAADDAEARDRLVAFFDALDAFGAAGGTLMWTVHNVLPHDARFADLEIELARRLVERAAVVHVLSPETVAATAPHYRLDPDRTVVIEHSSFAGLYPDWITRGGVRARFDLDPSDKVMIVLGGIRPYKGIDRLLDIFDEMVEDDPTLRLMVVGKPGDQPGIAELEARCAAHPRIWHQFKRVSDGSLQALFAAADVAVLPYLNILNSSAFQLALTFGVPVVGPRMGALQSYAGEPYVRLFDPPSDADLKSVLTRAMADFVGDERLRDAVKAAAATRPPEQMASAFSALVADLLSR